MMTSEPISMTLDGSVRWQRYAVNSGQGELLFAEGLPTETTDELADTLTARLAFSKQRPIGDGGSGKVFRNGAFAVKCFTGEHSDIPEMSGRVENLRISIQVTEALRAWQASPDTDWALRGAEYYGAYINRRFPRLTRWAIEHVDGSTMSEVMRLLPERYTNEHVQQMNNELFYAINGAQMDYATVFTDGLKPKNYLVPKASLEQVTHEDAKLEVIKVDTGSRV